jgi:hypothetical protein
MLNTTKTTATPIIEMAQTARFLALDIETGNAPIEAVEAAIENLKPPANIKDPEKIAAKMAEMAQKRAERAALLDASPILCIACKTDTGGVIFDSMGATGLEIHNWTVSTSDNEKSMLQAFRTWVDGAITPDTLITGHNCKAFDLPKIRNAFIRHRLKLPLFLMPALRNETTCEVIDTMQLGKAFTMQHRFNDFISLDTLADILQIQRPKQAMSGADVPAAHERGEFAPILIYCCIDTETTAQAFQLMTGISPVLH